MGAESTRPLTEEAEALNLLAELRRLVAEHFVPARGYLTLPQAAAYLGTAPGTVREWIRTKRLPFWRCLNCGNYEDLAILEHRRLCILPDPGGRARTSVYDPERGAHLAAAGERVMAPRSSVYPVRPGKILTSMRKIPLKAVLRAIKRSLKGSPLTIPGLSPIMRHLSLPDFYLRHTLIEKATIAP